MRDKKIASIGVGIKKWISFHGMAININPDLRLFSLIRPCGLDVTMTSVQEVTGRAIKMKAVRERAKYHINRIFSLSERCAGNVG